MPIVRLLYTSLLLAFVWPSATGAAGDDGRPTDGGARAAGPRPNIVFLQADSVDGRLFDPTDADMFTTLLIDALRVNYLDAGVNFARHYTNSPQCVPSRTSMFVSRYVHESWTPNNGQGFARSTRTGALDDSCVAFWGRAACAAMADRQNISATLVDAVREAGYRFAPFGRFDVGAGILQDYPPNTDGDGFHDGPELGILARGAALPGAIDARGPLANTDSADPDPFAADVRRAAAAKEWLMDDDPAG